MLRLLVIASPSDHETVGTCLECISRAAPDVPCSVFCDTAIAGADNHELLEVDIDLTDGLSYLSCIHIAGREFSEEWFMFLDPRTLVENRFSEEFVISLCGRSPIHSPVLCNLETHETIKSVSNASASDFAKCLRFGGVGNEPAYCSNAFLILKRCAISHVCNLATQFCATARKANLTFSSIHGINYAMQVLCADTSKHRTMGHSGACGWRLRSPDDTSLYRTILESKQWPQFRPELSRSSAMLSTTFDVDFVINHKSELGLR